MLSDEQLRHALRSCPHDAVEALRVRWLYAKDFASAIEAEVRKQDDALIRQMLEALKQFQYRACESIHPDFVDEAIAAARARLGEQT